MAKYFLGISGGILAGNQDGAAALVKGGEIIAAAEEERFVRTKHASGLLPKRAIQFCLNKAGITINDVATVAFAGKTYKNFRAILKDYFEFHFGYSPRVALVDHHRAHAASTYYTWGRDHALILTMDFSGDRTSTLAAVGRGLTIKELWRLHKPDSLGVFYSMLTQYLGFQKDSDEYKVMGLASYGRPRYDLATVIALDTQGYHLNTKFIKTSVRPHLPASSKQERLYLHDLSLPKRGRLSDDPIPQYYRDVAASGQKALEDIVVHLVGQLVRQTGIRKLCLAGGVALNCVMNQKIRESGLVDELFVPPHVSDAGLSIGGALLESVGEGVAPVPIEHAYFGPEYSDSEIQQVLTQCKLAYSKPRNLEAVVAGDLASGKIVGWFQGRMEFGPRALGNRSILADCRDPQMSDRINRLVKFRESFRPFTPSVLEEKCSDYFEAPMSSPYMTLTFAVKPDKRKVIPAVTHVDGTARIHTVSKKTNPRYHRLISEFEALTCVPMLLNTSMNIMGQPMVCAPRQAVENYFATGMDALAIGPFYLTKRMPVGSRR